MQIPTEILSLIATRADSCADTRQRTPECEKSHYVFNRILDEARTATDSEIEIASGKTDDVPDDERPGTPAQKKADGNTDADEVLVAGAMGDQNLVVYILEGDKESATDPETVADPIGTCDASGIESYTPPSAEIQTDTADAKPEEAQIAVDATRNAAGGADKMPDIDTADTAVKAPVVEIADAINENNGASGEVTARRPTIRTSDRYEDKEDSSGFSKNGDLSPLENGNDTTPVKEQAEKKYPEKDNASNTGNSEKNTTGDAQMPINGNPMPFAEGVKPEQFRADQQMKRAADAPVKTENLFEEMVSRIETMHTESSQSVTIQLKPEVLGKVALEIAMDATGLHVRINAADSDVRSMINGQINALIESLGNKGIEVAEVEVAYTGVDNGTFQSSQKEQAQPDRQRRSFNAGRIEDGATYYAALPFDPLEYYLDAEVSSVEYRA